MQESEGITSYTIKSGQKVSSHKKYSGFDRTRASFNFYDPLSLLNKNQKIETAITPWWHPEQKQLRSIDQQNTSRLGGTLGNIKTNNPKNNTIANIPFETKTFDQKYHFGLKTPIVSTKKTKQFKKLIHNLNVTDNSPPKLQQIRNLIHQRTVNIKVRNKNSSDQSSASKDLPQIAYPTEKQRDQKTIYVLDQNYKEPAEKKINTIQLYFEQKVPQYSFRQFKAFPSILKKEVDQSSYTQKEKVQKYHTKKFDPYKLMEKELLSQRIRKNLVTSSQITEENYSDYNLLKQTRILRRNSQQDQALQSLFQDLKLQEKFKKMEELNFYQQKKDLDFSSD